MQFPIAAENSRLFSSAFYNALAEGRSITSCINAGRQAIAGEIGIHQWDWVAPTFYTSVDDYVLMNNNIATSIDISDIDLNNLIHQPFADFVVPTLPLDFEREFSDFRPIPPQQAVFWIAQYPITNRQFQLFLDDPENSFWQPQGQALQQRKVETGYLQHWGAIKCPQSLLDYPIINVSWHAAHAYMHWVRKHYHKHIRLPTVMEWEIAARAGRPDPDWWQIAMQAHEINCQQTSGRLDRVDAFAANPYEVRGLLGNVYELCTFVNEKNFVQVRGCGGAYHSTPEDCIKGVALSPSVCRPDLGFRCVLEHNETASMT